MEPDQRTEINDGPVVSMILPIRNEAEAIGRCLDSIIVQEYARERIETIVVDGMSEDCTREIVEEFASHHPNIRLLSNTRRIVPVALNIGIRAARGSIIVRVDGHTAIAPDYVEQCVAALQRTGADNVGGRMDARSTGFFGETVALATSSPFGIGGSRFHYSQREEWVDTVYLGAYRRELFDRIGLFDEEMVRDQDDEFNYRLRAQGGRIRLCPQIRSEYTNRSSPSRLWKQYYEYGYWKVRVLQKHPRQMSWRHFMPPAFVLALSSGVVLLFFGMPWSLLITAGSYILACSAASMWVAAKSGIRYLCTLPAVFAILHMSYGVGFLVGLIRFFDRWLG